METENNVNKKTYEFGLIVGTKREREYWEKKIKDKIKEVTKLYNEIYEFPEPKVEETPEGQLIYQIRYNTDKEALRIVRVIINQLLEEEWLNEKTNIYRTS